MEKLRLYYPVRPFHINQHWSDNLPCVLNFGETNQIIVTGKDNFTCPVGYEKLYPNFGMSGHNGTDLQAGVQPVYAAVAGVVIEKQTVPARGLGLGILTNEQYDFGEMGVHYGKVRYWHLRSFNKEVGDKVEVGDIIGVSNNTGYSSGNHLHFELNLFDKDAGGHPVQFNYAGMIAGSISTEPFLTGIYADEYKGKVSALQQYIIQLRLIIANLLKPH